MLAGASSSAAGCASAELVGVGVFARFLVFFLDGVRVGTHGVHLHLDLGLDLRVEPQLDVEQAQLANRLGQQHRPAVDFAVHHTGQLVGDDGAGHRAVQAPARAGAHFDLDADLVERSGQLPHVVEPLEPHLLGLARQALDALQGVVGSGHGEVLGDEVVAGEAILDLFHVAALGHTGHVLQKDNSHFRNTPRDDCANGTA